MKRQREEKEELIRGVDCLKAQLRDVDMEMKDTITERDRLQRQLTYAKAESERYQRENRDLQSQVTQLLSCIEFVRQGYDAETTPLIASPNASSRYRSDQLVLFR